MSLGRHVQGRQQGMISVMVSESSWDLIE
uniref:Uncharacterized protein n=1 Tax=Anguilla anguilla TaxID=7936 RepID=A0A0E9TZV2_ANGAN